MRSRASGRRTISPADRRARSRPLQIIEPSSGQSRSSRKGNKGIRANDISCTFFRSGRAARLSLCLAAHAAARAQCASRHRSRSRRSAGLRMLARGGNAVDAALATAISLTVVEPCQNGIGSDAFAIIWADGKTARTERVGPRAARADARPFRRPRCDAACAAGTRVTVPGTVSAWRVLSERFGKLPFADLFEPAIRYATRRLSRLAHGAAAVAGAGRNADRAARLSRSVRAERPRAAARREIGSVRGRRTPCSASRRPRAKRFIMANLPQRSPRMRARTGGVIDESDLAAHRPDWVEPISMDYRDITLHEIGPNGQGIGALMALGMLDNFDIAARGLDSRADAAPAARGDEARLRRHQRICRRRRRP